MDAKQQWYNTKFKKDYMDFICFRVDCQKKKIITSTVENTLLYKLGQKP